MISDVYSQHEQITSDYSDDFLLSGSFRSIFILSGLDAIHQCRSITRI